ncbi:MAG: hypothetical protein ACREMS_04985 [Gemmatimonadaceae bacterium]
MKADADVFETVVQSQITPAAGDSAMALRSLRVDSRPVADTGPLATGTQPPAPLNIDSSADSLSPNSLAKVAGQRKAILADLHVEEGGPFLYPACGGTRVHRLRDSSLTTTGSDCPAEWRRYVTVGLPVRGAAAVLSKLRDREEAPPDSSAELWTVLVTENTIGPSGQTWRQYACLLRRDPETDRLALVERFLVSYAE